MNWTPLKVWAILLFGVLWTLFIDVDLPRVVDLFLFGLLGSLTMIILIQQVREDRDRHNPDPYTAILYQVHPKTVPIENGTIRIPMRIYRTREYDGRPYQNKYDIKRKFNDRNWNVEEVVRDPADEVPYPGVASAPKPHEQ